MSRPPGYVSGVIISPKIAYLIETRAALTTLRTTACGEDGELDTVLNAIRWAAMQYATSVNGSEPRKSTEATPRLKEWLTPQEVANHLRITSHAVRLAIRQKKLPARKENGRYMIAAADFAAYTTANRK